MTVINEWRLPPCTCLDVGEEGGVDIESVLGHVRLDVLLQIRSEEVHLVELSVEDVVADSLGGQFLQSTTIHSLSRSLHSNRELLIADLVVVDLLESLDGSQVDRASRHVLDRCLRLALLQRSCVETERCLKFHRVLTTLLLISQWRQKIVQHFASNIKKNSFSEKETNFKICRHKIIHFYLTTGRNGGLGDVSEHPLEGQSHVQRVVGEVVALIHFQIRNQILHQVGEFFECLNIYSSCKTKRKFKGVLTRERGKWNANQISPFNLLTRIFSYLVSILLIYLKVTKF